MILRPRLNDIKIIGYYLGRISIGLGLTMFIPCLLGLFLGEINPAFDFLLGIEATFIFGLILMSICFTEENPNWMQGMIVVSLSWLVAMAIGAIPLYLSGHWKSFLDACFDSMSGFSTTGLVLVQDLDHMSFAHNLWRHLIIFIGGQGIIIVAVAFFVKGFSGAFRMYVGEGRDEKILPNVVNTSRFIWMVSIVYLIFWTIILGLAGILEGMQPFTAFFHGACIFMAAFDTGGFTPQSQNILYYHSAVYEIVTIAIMILGALNFKLHYNVWMGNRREIIRDIEARTFFCAALLVFFITALGLSQGNIYHSTIMVFRKGFYQLISAHTTTGFQTIYTDQFVKEWNDLSLVGIIAAMAIGGAVCSTTGAIKMLRIGIIFKALIQDIKRIIFPESAVVIKKFQHFKEILLTDAIVRSACLITLAYLILYALGALVGMLCGYPFLYALFESTSAAANVGLSVGITNAGMPAFLKLTYIIQMWAGRLEFMSVFTLLGFFIAAIKGK